MGWPELKIHLEIRSLCFSALNDRLSHSLCSRKSWKWLYRGPFTQTKLRHHWVASKGFVLVMSLANCCYFSADSTGSFIAALRYAQRESYVKGNRNSVCHWIYFFLYSGDTPNIIQPASQEETGNLRLERVKTRTFLFSYRENLGINLTWRPFFGRRTSSAITRILSRWCVETNL